MPELLSPAGDFECATAAVENGADAVYFGLDNGFNARARANNISLETLPELMQFLHGRQVKGFVTLNTLVFSDELEKFEQVVRAVAHAGVDAVLVQDLGMVRLIRAVCPDLAIHASTQMTMTSAETIAEIESLGIERVVLARELSLAEITQISQGTTLELEVFAHGALCVAYSGQCMTSESLGGRSANRGQCAQACRLPYDLICDGQDVELDQQQYLLSPQDLAAFELVPELVDAGVACVKIEGRLKTPEYVANMTHRYREAIEQTARSRRVEFSPRVVEEMELSFSRGFSPGWLQGCDHKMLVPATTSAKHGVPLGSIVRVESRVQVKLSTSLRCGDGIAFAGDRLAGTEQGGRVYEIWRDGQSTKAAQAGQTVELGFQHGAIDFGLLQPGQALWKTDDPQLTKRLRQSFGGKYPQRKVTIDLEIDARVDEPLRLVARAGSTQVTAVSDDALPAARTKIADADSLKAQIDRFGNTAYQLGEVSITVDGKAMVPHGILGQARHRLIDSLDDALTQVPQRRIATSSVIAALRPTPTAGAADEGAASSIHILCRSLTQLRHLVDAGHRNLIADFQDIREFGDAVQVARAGGSHLLLATPRIQKPGEMGIFKAMSKHDPDGILARNLSGLSYFQSRVASTVADFSLNCTNELTAAWLKDQGATRITASYDMNRDQLTAMVENTPTAWLEIVIHQHMPMFHMEHCVFCAVLSPGTNKTNCGRPCDFHEVKMRDRVGMEHVLHADVGCRNTLFNAQPQSGAEAVPQLQQAGLRHFRIELLGTETPVEIDRLSGLYQQLILGQLPASEVWTQLKAANRVGVTRGTMEEKRNPLAIL